jgi:glutamine cyclotransferase
VIRYSQLFALLTVALAVAGLDVSAQGTGSAIRVPPTASKAPVSGYTVVSSYPHDPTAFTQGLEFRDGVLYEGIGLQGRSAVRRVELETGKCSRNSRFRPDISARGLPSQQGSCSS